MDLSKEEMDGAVAAYTELLRERERLRTADPRKGLRNKALEYKHAGNRTYNPLHIDWGALFTEKRCPVCGDTFKQIEEEYRLLCYRCGFHIPVDLYNRSMETQEKEAGVERGIHELTDELKKKGLTQEELDNLYTLALKNLVGEERGSEPKKEEE